MTASTRTLNGTKKSPAIASRNSGSVKSGSAQWRSGSTPALLRALDPDARVPHHPGGLRHQLRLLGRMVLPELEDEVLVLLLLGAFGHVDHPVVLHPLVAGGLGSHPEGRDR